MFWRHSATVEQCVYYKTEKLPILIQLKSYDFLLWPGVRGFLVYENKAAHVSAFEIKIARNQELLFSDFLNWKRRKVNVSARTATYTPKNGNK